MRFSRFVRYYRKPFLVGILFTFACLLYCQLSVVIYGTYMWRNLYTECVQNSVDRKDLITLLHTTHRILNKHQLDHFLVYGSLWGVLRMKRILPWDYDFDFGLLKEDVDRVDMDAVRRDLNKENITLIYRYYSGSYKVFYRQITGDLYLWSDFYGNGLTRRIGIESYIFFYHYRTYHQFPTRLVKKPLPLVEFQGGMFHVPHEGIEMQKHIFRKNWWKVEKPPSCYVNQTNGG